jgi:hypothetical protein
MGFTYAKGNGGDYAYFYCLGRTRGTGCEQPYVPVDLIETVENAYGDVRLPRKRRGRPRRPVAPRAGPAHHRGRPSRAPHRSRRGFLHRHRGHPWQGARSARQLPARLPGRARASTAAMEPGAPSGWWSTTTRSEAEIAEPFATLADPDLPKSLGGEAVTASAVSSGAGSSEAIPVEPAGFEPAASSVQGRRSAN